MAEKPTGFHIARLSVFLTVIRNLYLRRRTNESKPLFKNVFIKLARSVLSKFAMLSFGGHIRHKWEKVMSSPVKSVLAAAISLISIGAHAATITVDTNLGAAGGLVSNIKVLEWDASPVLAVGGNQAVINYLNWSSSGGALNPANPYAAPTAAGVTNDLSGSPILGYSFEVYSQGILGSFTGGTGAVAGLNSTYQITYEFGYTEIMYEATRSTISGNGTANFDFAAVQTVNYFRIYLDNLAGGSAANLGSGAGFNDGTLVFEGEIRPVENEPHVSNFTTSGVTPGAATDPLNTQSLCGSSKDCSTTSSLGPLETVTGTGSTSAFDLMIMPVTLNPAFWVSGLDSLLVDNISQTLAFSSSEPSEKVAGLVPDIGSVNGQVLSGAACQDRSLFCGSPDILFQTDTNSPVDRTVPEPGTLALFGIALAGLGFSRFRKV
jgi:hypothetical protein